MLALISISMLAIISMFISSFRMEFRKLRTCLMIYLHVKCLCMNIRCLLRHLDAGFWSIHSWCLPLFLSLGLFSKISVFGETANNQVHLEMCSPMAVQTTEGVVERIALLCSLGAVRHFCCAWIYNLGASKWKPFSPLGCLGVFSFPPNLFLWLFHRGCKSIILDIRYLYRDS